MLNNIGQVCGLPIELNVVCDTGYGQLLIV